MKVTYISASRIDNLHAWSGLPHHMAASLKSAGLEVNILDSLQFPRLLWPERIARYGVNKLGLAPRHTWLFDPRVLRDYARQLNHQIDSLKGDVIFASGSVYMAFVKSSRPIVFWSDATYANLINYYFSENEVDEITWSNGNAMELAALQNASLGFYSSSWAAESAVRDYQMSAERVHIIPFGANFHEEPTDEKVAEYIHSRPKTPCRLFFLGVDWDRKDGTTALAVAEHLTQMGLPCELTLAGCQPPHGTHLPAYVRSLGSIDKDSAEGKKLLQRLFSEAHFFLLPSRADCTPVVFSEANSYGVPVLTTATGGIPSIIRNGINGFCVARDESLVAHLAQHVLDTLSDHDRYLTLAKTSRREYTSRLNWKTSGQEIRRLLEKL